MKIVLINPPVILKRGRASIQSVIDNLFYNSPPLGLGYLAAVLERQGESVAIIDAAVERLTIGACQQRLKKLNPDFIGITSTTNMFDCAVELATQIKRVMKHVPIILGGAHVSTAPEHALSYTCFDVGVLGEGEVTFAELLDCLKSQGDIAGVKGTAFRENGAVKRTAPREEIQCLDSLPQPARHLLPLALYRPQPNDQFRLPKLSMITSRGCPYQCIFCDKSVFGSRFRAFSPGYIVTEMEHLIREYGARDIAFLDSIFTVSPERVEAVIEEMRRRNIKVSWTCTARANVVTKDLLKKMKQAGCWRIRLGVESGNDRVLQFIQKGITKEQVENAARWASEAGLQTKGFFMLGHLPDTKETIEETISFANSLPLQDITVQINTPMINTPQRALCGTYGTLLTEAFDKMSYWEPVFVPRGLTKGYLEEAYARFYRSFYLRPSIFLKHLLHIRTWYNAVKYLNSLRLIVHLFFCRKKTSYD